MPYPHDINAYIQAVAQMWRRQGAKVLLLYRILNCFKIIKNADNQAVFQLYRCSAVNQLKPAKHGSRGAHMCFIYRII